MGPEGLSGPHEDLAGALALGTAHERAQHPDERRRRGAHFTPYDLASRLVAVALDGVDVDASFTMCDPACGGGVFLLATAEALVARGWSRLAAVRAVCGADIDPATVEVARAALARWAGVDEHAVRDRVVVADALVDAPFAAGSFTLVAGNPPFLNQLQSGTARRGAHVDAAAGLGAAGAPYADTSALFLAHGLDLVRHGGRVVLLQPQSVLVARDAGAVRAHVLGRATLRALWWSDRSVFEADVRVCAPVLERGPAAGGAAARTQLYQGGAVAPGPVVAAPVAGETWGGLVAGLLGVPAVSLDGTRRLRDVAHASAGFRDEYYGLVGAVHDVHVPPPPDALRLVTCGLVDVLASAWGTRPARFARAKYAAPAVDPARLDARTRAWVDAQRVPKVLVATQTKVIEAYVDEVGVDVPCTPVIAVHAPVDRLWHVAAALSAPCISAHALALVAGAALSAQAIKLAARQVLDLPLPVDDAAWAEGAALAKAAAGAPAGPARTELLDRMGVVMDHAYGGADPAVLAWWRDRRGP